MAAPSKREQVAPSSTSGDDASVSGGDNILCDIIAQQREFQLHLRQESSRLSSVAGAAASSAGSSRGGAARLAMNQRQMTLMTTSGGRVTSAASSRQAGQQATSSGSNNSRPQTRRKFSLSLAMSNLASFATSSPQHQKQESKSPPGAPIRPPRRERDSLTHSPEHPTRDASRTFSSSSSSGNNNNNDTKQQAASGADGRPPSATPSAAEKKRGLVHKAIRRGSKMFDSMLLSSALRQSQQSQAEDDSHKQHHEQLSSSSSSGHDKKSADEAGRKSSSDNRVQFAAEESKKSRQKQKDKEKDKLKQKQKHKDKKSSIDDDEDEVERAVRHLQELNNRDDDEDDEQTFGRRRRRLRLGSIPSDLRRALSLGGSHAHHRKRDTAGSAKSKLAPEREQSEEGTDRAHKTGDEQQCDSAPDQGVSRLRQETAPRPPGSGPPPPAPPPHNSSSCSSSSAGSLMAGLNSSGKANFKPAPLAAPNGAARLKRKNSLFAPLTNVAYYHHHSSASSRQSQQSQQPSPGAGLAQSHQSQQQAQQVSPSKPGAHPNHQAQALGAPGSTSSQSASFSLCQDHSRTYKLIIFGSSAVGKTSLIQRFLYGHFPVTHKPTVEELHSNKYNIPELGEIYLEILDTSGTFEFPAMRRLSIEKGDAFILVYSVADESSWQEVIHLRGLILEEKQGSAAILGAGLPPDLAANQNHSGLAKKAHVKPASSAKTPSNCATGVGANESDTGNKQQQPIASVYAAATRLAAASRRTSSSPMLGKQQPDAGTRRTSISQQKSSLALGSGANVPEINSQYNNSQLSKVLSQQAASSEGHVDGDDDDDEDDDDDGDGDGDGQECAAHAARGDNGCDSSLALGRNKPDGLASGQSFKFDQLEAQRLLQQQHTRVGGPPIVVVANKCDLDTSSHQVNSDEAERLVRDQWGNSFVSCSAKESLNIDRVFKELLRQARAPEILSTFVIDDHQQRRQSLPVLKNQLSAHHVKGLRNLYNQQQQHQQQQNQQQPQQQQQLLQPRPASQAAQSYNLQRESQLSMSACNQDGSQCAIM